MVHVRAGADNHHDAGRQTYTLRRYELYPGGLKSIYSTLSCAQQTVCLKKSVSRH